MENKIISQLLENVKSNSNFPPTLLYNEGWMLRLVLQQLKEGNIKHEKLTFPKNEKVDWYSEAYLPSPFLQRDRGDELAESHTHADGIIGKFGIRKDTKSGIVLNDDCDFFYIIEAKIHSKLDTKTKNAKNYNQVARNVACILQLIYEKRETIKIDDFKKIGFYVLLPKGQKENKNIKTFKKFMDKDDIRISIEERMGMYTGKDEKEKKKDIFSWIKKNLDDFIEKLDIDLITWEELLGKKNDSEIWKFYDKCLTPYSYRKQ